jgi:cyclase
MHMKQFAPFLPLVALLVATGATGQQPVPEVKIEPINDHLFMVLGLGGNLALSIGEDATFIVDDQMQPIIPKLRAAIAELTPRPVDFVLNTHWHFDHSGGNEAFGGAGALIVAHDNVYERMSTEQVSSLFGSVRPPSPQVALPVITFDHTTTLHLNGDTIIATHLPAAHTDGDVLVHFVESNVYHLGDTFFTSSYPFFDIDSGGSVNGLVHAVDTVLAQVDGEAVIIPGHGYITDRAGLQEYRDMLVTIRDRVAKLIGEGADRDAVMAAKPTAEFDARWGQSEFMPVERWLPLVYMSLSQP